MASALYVSFLLDPQCRIFIVSRFYYDAECHYAESCGAKKSLMRYEPSQTGRWGAPPSTWSPRPPSWWGSSEARSSRPPVDYLIKLFTPVNYECSWFKRVFIILGRPLQPLGQEPTQVWSTWKVLHFGLTHKH